MSMSGTPSPSRSPKRTLRPAPNSGVLNFFHSLGLGFFTAQPREFGLAGGDVWPRSACLGVARPHVEVLKTRRPWATIAALPLRSSASLRLDYLLSVDERTDARAFGLDFQRIVAGGIVDKAGAAQVFPVALAQFGFEWQMEGQARLVSAREAEVVIVAVGVVAESESNAGHSIQRLHFHFDTVVAPLRIASKKDGIAPLFGRVIQLLFEIGMAIFIADQPGIHVGKWRWPTGPAAHRDEEE